MMHSKYLNLVNDNENHEGIKYIFAKAELYFFVHSIVIKCFFILTRWHQIHLKRTAAHKRDIFHY